MATFEKSWVTRKISSDRTYTLQCGNPRYAEQREPPEFSQSTTASASKTARGDSSILAIFVYNIEEHLHPFRRAERLLFPFSFQQQTLFKPSLLFLRSICSSSRVLFFLALKALLLLLPRTLRFVRSLGSDLSFFNLHSVANSTKLHSNVHPSLTCFGQVVIEITELSGAFEGLVGKFT